MFDTLAEAATAYASWGWSVMPCHWIEDGECSCGDPDCRSPGKHPLAELVPRGFHQASDNPLLVEEWWRRFPKANIAIRTGNGLCVLDSDRKEHVDGEDTLQEWERQYGRLPDTLTVITGGGGFHRYFYYPKTMKIASRVGVLGPGVDVRADGGYVLAPMSNHKTGMRYEWELDHHPENTPPAQMPKALLEALQATQTDSPSAAQQATESYVIRLPESQVAEIRSALEPIPADDRELWVKIGQALQSTHGGEQAFKLWEEWSKKSAKFDADDARRVWRSFRNHGITISSLFHAAKGYGWTGIALVPDVVVEAEDAPRNDADDLAEQLPPNELWTIPGALGRFVRWVNQTSPLVQPEFAVAAGLALGSVVCGRMYCSSQRNFTSLYMMVVGPSGCGKEHGSNCITEILVDSGYATLVSGGGYTSDGAVFSTLLDKPAHIAVIDEIGMMLEGAKAKGNHIGASVLSAMTQIFSKCNTVYKPKEYSKMGLTKEQRAKLDENIIHNPCLTLYGMTTSHQLLPCLSSKEIANGFLNRWVIVETAVKWGEWQEVTRQPPPADVVAWIQQARKPRTGNVPTEEIAGLAAVPYVVPFTKSALDALQVYSDELNRTRESLYREEMDEMVSRCREQAMRIAVILAVSDNVHIPVIDIDHISWAIQYVKHYSEKMIEVAKYGIHDTAYEGQVQTVLKGLKRHPDGVTVSDMHRLKPFRTIPTDQRNKILASLQEGGQIQLVEIATNSRPKRIWKLV